MTSVSVDRAELFQTAHRVWTQFNTGLAPDIADIDILKDNARPGERRLRVDILALRIIEREWA